MHDFGVGRKAQHLSLVLSAEPVLVANPTGFQLHFGVSVGTSFQDNPTVWYRFQGSFFRGSPYGPDMSKPDLYQKQTVQFKSLC